MAEAQLDSSTLDSKIEHAWAGAPSNQRPFPAAGHEVSEELFLDILRRVESYDGVVQILILDRPHKPVGHRQLITWGRKRNGQFVEKLFTCVTERSMGAKIAAIREKLPERVTL